MYYTQKGNILIILVTVIAVALAGVGYLYFNNIGNIRNLATVQQTPPSVTHITGEAQIAISRTGFIPATITVKQGTQVTWTNKDKAPHQVISNLPNLDSEEPLNENDSFSYIFESAGTFTYHDEENSKYKGTVIVE